MGMYNELVGTCKCPYCGSDNGVFEQIKWEGVVRNLKRYTVGDKLTYEEDFNAPIGITYSYCSYLRNDMINSCDKCDKTYPYVVNVSYGTIMSIEPMDESARLKCIKNMETRLALLKVIYTYASSISKDDEGMEYYIEQLYPFNFDILGFEDGKVKKYIVYEAIDKLTMRIQLYKSEPLTDESLFREYISRHPLKMKHCPNCNKLVYTRVNYIGQYCNICYQKLDQDISI